jgi:hypothetical protein
MSSRLVRNAVKQLALYLRTNLPTHLRATESAESLSSMALTNPVQVVEAFVPHDNRSPLYQVYANRFEFEDQRNGHFAVDCTVIGSFVGNANAEALTTFVDRHLTAAILCLTTSMTLGGTVMQALITDGDRAVSHGEESIIRQAFSLGVMLRLQETL